MTIPSYEKLMPFVLEYSQDERKINDSSAYFSDLFNLTDEERSILIPSGTKPLIRSRMEWAVTYLVQAGLINRPKRGYYIITEEGKKVLNRDKDKINLAYLKSIPVFREFLSRSNEKEESGDKSNNNLLVDELPIINLDPEERIGIAYQEIITDLKSQIISRILSNSPRFFEVTVVTLLKAMGYGGSGLISEVIGRPGDGGIDGIIHQDKLGLDVVYIQAKRYAPENKVQRQELQAFIGTLVGVSASKGVFVTTSDFTQGAITYLNTVNVRVVTINGSRLVDLMLEHSIGVKIKQKLELYRIDEDFFLEE
jgi:restriction system protein